MHGMPDGGDVHVSFMWNMCQECIVSFGVILILEKAFVECYFHMNWNFGSIIGPVHKGMNDVPKAVLECDSDPFLI